MYVRLFCTIMNPPMIVRMYKVKNFYSGFETQDGCPSEYEMVETKNRASIFFKLSITITSSQGRVRRECQIFFKHAGFNHYKLLHGLYIKINQPGRFIFTHKPVYIL